MLFRLPKNILYAYIYSSVNKKCAIKTALYSLQRNIVEVIKYPKK